MSVARTSKERSLPALLREAERRVNQHVWGDRRAIVSIPARPDEDVDLLLMKAADQIDAMASVGIRQEREIERLQAVVAGMIQGLKDADRAAHETRAQWPQSAIDEVNRLRLIISGPVSNELLIEALSFLRAGFPVTGLDIINRIERFLRDHPVPEGNALKAFVQLCAPHGKDWLTCPECAKAAGIGK